MIRIIYHVADLDGKCSGAIARYYYDKMKFPYEMVPMNYGDDLPFDQWAETDELVFMDVSIQPQDKMISIMQRFKTILIDHHKTSIGLEKYMVDGIISMDNSACELSWSFFIRKTMPKFVKLLGRYDIWDNKDIKKWNEEIMPFQQGMNLFKTDPYYDDNFKLWSKWIESDNNWIDDVIKDGNVAWECMKNIYNKGASNLCHDVIFEGKKAIVANTFLKNSQFFTGYYDPLIHDIMIAWTWNGNRYDISIYTTSNIDVSEIAKKYGGGGHKQAAGFNCKHISFNNGVMEVQ